MMAHAGTSAARHYGDQDRDVGPGFGGAPTPRLFLEVSMPDKVRVAIVGLGFGAEFIPIYQKHPNAEMPSAGGIERARRGRRSVRREDALHVHEDLLADPNVDAVHINSPIADHGRSRSPR